MQRLGILRLKHLQDIINLRHKWYLVKTRHFLPIIEESINGRDSRLLHLLFLLVTCSQLVNGFDRLHL